MLKKFVLNDFSLFLQSSTRPLKLLLAACQTKAARIRPFSTRSSTCPAREWVSRAKRLALSPWVRKWGVTVSNGGLHLSKSCTRPTSGRRTPARRRGRLWWRSATGRKTQLSDERLCGVALTSSTSFPAEPSVFREASPLPKLRDSALTWSPKWEFITGLPTDVRRRPSGKSWLWTPSLHRRTVSTHCCHTARRIIPRPACPLQVRVHPGDQKHLLKWSMQTIFIFHDRAVTKVLRCILCDGPAQPWSIVVKWGEKHDFQPFLLVNVVYMCSSPFILIHLNEI